MFLKPRPFPKPKKETVSETSAASKMADATTFMR
jgi:hypothetical protein